MKFAARILFAVALLFTTATWAAQGTIGVATTDAVSVSINGWTYANVHWQVLTAGTATVTTEYTQDGVNWKAAPYSVRTDQVTANPAAAAQQNAAPVVGGYDTPIPGNAVAFRVRCGTTGTSTVVAVTAGQVYLGQQVPAILYDVTSAVNTLNDTGVLDVSGWVGFSATYTTPAGGSGAVNDVDETGANTVLVTVPASATAAGVFSAYGVAGTAYTATGVVAIAWRGRRVRCTSIAVAALTSRIRIVAWR